MFFSNWHAIVRIVIVGVCSYTVLVLLLRVSGKRTLAKFNAFDFVVTVALGSTLATVLLSKDTALLDGVAALALLVGLQFAVAWLASRSEFVDRVVKSQPRLLFYQGRFLRDAIRQERLTEGEIRAAIRQQGAATLEGVEAVVLETDGSLSVIARAQQPPTALHSVRGVPEADIPTDSGRP